MSEFYKQHLLVYSISALVYRHGLYRTDQVIYNDPELCFKETVPQTALFDPSGNHPVQDEGGSGVSDEEGEEAEGSKGRANSSNPVPLGWPKV